MKTYTILVMMILLASAMAIGCVGGLNGNGPGPTDKTPTIVPTQAPQPTMAPSPTLVAYDTGRPQKVPLTNKVLVTHTRTLRGEDWMLPTPQISNTRCSHGVVQELIMENPTSETLTVSAGEDLKSIIVYKYEGKLGFALVYDVFYNESSGFFGSVTLAPSERRKVMMYSYIVDDSKYDQYRGYYLDTVGIDANPRYVPM